MTEFIEAKKLEEPPVAGKPAGESWLKKHELLQLRVPNLALVLLRFVYLLVAALLGILLIKSNPSLVSPPWLQWVVLLGVVAVAAVTIVLDMVVPRKRLDTISAIYFGLIVGLFLTYIVNLSLQALPMPDNLRSPVTLVTAMVLCYTCISLLLQTRHDFRFIIPYVEFSKEVKGAKPYVLDTSVVIDGRIADVVETKFLEGQLVVPRFVLNELQGIADSSDRLRRTRGRRGLDVLNRLRAEADVDLQIFDRELPEFAGQTVDVKLVLLAKHLDGKIVTNDYNLNKVARLHGVGVLNLNDLANALKPVFLPGESFEVRLVKPGEEAGQGVGYLDDGTMVVVESGRDHLQHNVRVVVTSVLQTSAGRMVFGRFDSIVSGTSSLGKTPAAAGKGSR